MLGSAEEGVAPPTRNPNQPWARDSHQCRPFRTGCRASTRLAGDQTEISSSRAAPQALQDRRLQSLHRPDAS
jgi:hypothetical protein